MDEMKHGADEIVLAPETILSDEVAAEDSVPHDEMVNEDVAVMVEPKQVVRMNEILELRQSNRKVFRTLLMRISPAMRRSPTVAVTSPPMSTMTPAAPPRLSPSPPPSWPVKQALYHPPKTKCLAVRFSHGYSFSLAAIHRKDSRFFN